MLNEFSLISKRRQNRRKKVERSCGSGRGDGWGGGVSEKQKRAIE